MSGSFKVFSITVTAALLSACGGQSDEANVGPAKVEFSPALVAQVDTDRIKAAADQGLQGGDDLRANNDGIDSAVGQGRMTACAVNLNGKAVGCSHDWAGAHGHGAAR